MLRITVELLPGGDESRKKHLGTATITNDGTGDEHRGNYVATRVARFDRKRRGPWDLLFLALRSAVGGRNR